VRIGTGSDGTMLAPGLSGPMLPADRAPVDLTPVSLVGSPTVLLLTGPRAIVVQTSRLGCDRPGEPAVHIDLAWIPCQGAGLVIGLDRQGRHAPPDLRLTAGTDPDLIVHNGWFYATGPDGSGVGIHPDGTRTEIRLGSGPAPAAQPTQSGPRDGQGAPRPGEPRPPRRDGPPTTPPPPFPNGPFANDDVVTGSTDAQRIEECAGTGAAIAQLPAQPGRALLAGGLAAMLRLAHIPLNPCSVYSYTAQLNPPQPWRDFPGTCTLLVTNGPGTGDISCAATSAPLGDGDGATWYVRVRACHQGACVTSATYEVTTTPPRPL
jgi:hypothetical protein